MKLCPHTNRELQRWKESPDYLIEPKLKILYYLKWSPLKYENNYFLEEYKNTYGKTYYEDEKHIRLLAKKRIEFLKPFLKKSFFDFGIRLCNRVFLRRSAKFI